MALVTLKNTVATLPKTDVSISIGALMTSAETLAVDIDEVKAMKDKFASSFQVDKDVLDVAIEIFAYEGFDPEIVYRHVLAVQGKHRMKEEDVVVDLQVLLVLQHLKGNVNASNFKSLKPEARNYVSNLFTKWQLQVVAKDNKRLAFTLPRLAASFPYQSCQVAASIKRDFSGICDSQVLPDCMKSSSFPSLIPLARDSSLLLCLAANAYRLDQALVITKKNYIELKEDDRKKLFEEQLKFTNISFYSPVMSSDARAFAVCELGLGTRDVYNLLKKVLKYSSADISNLCTEQKYLDDFRDFEVARAAMQTKIAADGTSWAVATGPVGGP